MSQRLNVARFHVLNRALVLGAILGQVVVGLICDRFGRKVALVGTTLMIVIGATLGTAAHGAHGSPDGLFWFLTFARGITGIVSISKLHRLDMCSDWFFRVSVASTRLPPPVPVRRPMRK